ncbi:MAG: hypothetical protein QOD75_2228, partial [Blastocatellia bacterium]|nr:hypothetical protein [Blastocatellia bacterium]
GGAPDYVLLFRKENDTRIAAWTTSPFPHPVSIPFSDLANTSGPLNANAPARQFQIISHTGQGLPWVTLQQDQLVISVKSSPQYLAF